MVHDAAAVAASRPTFTVRAQVIERTELGAQGLGGLVDGEKGRVVIFEHGWASPTSDAASLRQLRDLGEVQFAVG
jgi:hypothetical protein